MRTLKTDSIHFSHKGTPIRSPLCESGPLHLSMRVYVAGGTHSSVRWASPQMLYLRTNQMYIYEAGNHPITALLLKIHSMYRQYTLSVLTHAHVQLQVKSDVCCTSSEEVVRTTDSSKIGLSLGQWSPGNHTKYGYAIVHCAKFT